jgi:hypothetical protein
MSKYGKHRTLTCSLCKKEYRSDKLCNHLKELKAKKEGPFATASTRIKSVT